jgi:imidazolonepropionase-like amidohydrolase
MTPEQALTLATRNAAEALGKLNNLGTLENGKVADLIVVKGNPLEDIRLLQDHQNILIVMKEGTVEVDRRGA